MKKLSSHIPMSEASLRYRLSQCERESQELQNQIKLLESESEELTRKLEKNLGEFEILRRKYYRTKEQLAEAKRQNEKLVGILQESKIQIQELKEEVDKLCAPPNSYGTFIESNDDHTIDIDLEGRRLKVNVRPGIDTSQIQRGQQLVLNEALNVVDVAGYDTRGEVVQVKDILGEDRVIVIGRADEERVIQLSDKLRKEKINIGDHLMINPRSNYAIEKLPKSQVEEVVLEEVPNITYADIGGLDKQIEEIRDAIELPYIYPEEFKKHKLTPPKGILLYGPPGCGKTLIAKAVANSLAKQMEKKTGVKTKSYFLNVKGPELLNKYVGETEYKIREVFKKAKEKSKEDSPVIVFFDEMDSLFRLRGSGISSDMEATVVAQFLSEIDGVESLGNVIVIGATNRQDLIDPAVLRPGRLDIKIKIDRPNLEGAKAIFAIYLTPDLPLHEEELARFNHDREKTVKYLIDKTAERMYSTDDENKFLEVTYAKGEKEVFYFKDFASGAMIENIVRRAKKRALKRYIEKGEWGIKSEDLLEAVRDEYKENEDLPNTTNPDDWAKISGRKGEKIVNVRTLLGGEKGGGGRSIENITAGQYL
ncbi:MAG TPA: proteasome ATPase [Candidatus Limnocylindrales bacterium]|nr:proteasome ATPase [Candidatus Limnocylindrales bacterium]